MPRTPTKQHRRPSEMLSQLALTIGGSFFGASFGGLLTQFMNHNTTGMLIFAATGFSGFTLILIGVICRS